MSPDVGIKKFPKYRGLAINDTPHSWNALIAGTQCSPLPWDPSTQHCFCTFVSKWIAGKRNRKTSVRMQYTSLRSIIEILVLMYSTIDFLYWVCVWKFERDSSNIQTRIQTYESSRKSESFCSPQGGAVISTTGPQFVSILSLHDFELQPILSYRTCLFQLPRKKQCRWARYTRGERAECTSWNALGLVKTSV